MTKFGQRLQALRDERGVSISCLAQGTGISRKTIQRWEKGLTEPKSYSTITLLADFFHMPVESFYQDGNADPCEDVRQLREEVAEEVRRIREEVADLRRLIKGDISPQS